MNIYNTLYILEYTKIPILYCYSKHWYLNLSKSRYNYIHRDFDIFSYISDNYISWIRYDKVHRIIGPATIVSDINIPYNFFKFYYIQNNLIARYKQK